MSLLSKLFKKKKEAPKAPMAACTCPMCNLMNLLEPKLKGKPYDESLRKFIIAPTGLSGRSLKEISGEIKDKVKKKRTDEARTSYLALIGNALAREKVPVGDVRKYLKEYIKFSNKYKLHATGYFPSVNDCMKVMNHADEIVNIVREAYRKVKTP